MALKTKIEWCDATWNPVRGCSRVSSGCTRCYAERIAARFSGPGQPYGGLAEMKNGQPHWTGKVVLNEKHLLDPLNWKPGRRLHHSVTGKLCGRYPNIPLRIFVNSMSDLFHENLSDEDVDRVFAVMALCPGHIFQILTKRPERMLEYLGTKGGDALDIGTNEEALVMRWGAAAGRLLDGDWIWNEGKKFRPAIEHFIATSLGLSDDGEMLAEDDIYFPLPNVWLGVSDEGDQHWRIDLLRKTPAAFRFLSMEPLIYDPGELNLEGVHWLICGGESGPGARPMHPDWARSLRDQCQAAGVPFFFKQWGEYLPWDQQEGRNTHMSAAARANGSDRVGKRKAGRLLDGREWNEFPEFGR